MALGVSAGTEICVMSKIICDVCGTTYAETAAQCPICGCARNTTAQTAAGSVPGEDAGASYTYVRGGRFSKANVKKRNKTGKDFDRRTPAASTAQERVRRQEPREEEPPVKTNKVLVAVVVILLLAIVAVGTYIGIKYLFPQERPSDNPGSTTLAPGNSTATSTKPVIPCTDLTVTGSDIVFSSAGNGLLLNVVVTPADTTDKITFTSSDPDVAVVTNSGYVTAVGGGKAEITVTCGEKTWICKVECTFGQPVVPPTTTVPTPSVDPSFQLTLNRDDFSLFRVGETHTLFTSTDTVKASDITWRSEDESVATVVNGVVTAVAPGQTKVHAEYNGQTVSCIVRCTFEAPPAGAVGITMSDADGDATIEVGETFILTLRDAQGVALDVEWIPSEEGIVSIRGNRITGEAVGNITVTAVYNDVEFSCIVRVKPAA